MATKAIKSNVTTSNGVARIEFEAGRVLNTTPVARPIQSELPAEYAGYSEYALAAVECDIEMAAAGTRSYGVDVRWAESIYLRFGEVLRDIPDWKQCVGGDGKSRKAFLALGGNLRAQLLPIKKEREDYYMLCDLRGVDNPHMRWMRCADNVNKLLAGTRKLSSEVGEGEADGEEKTSKGAGAAKSTPDEMLAKAAAELFQRAYKLANDDKYDSAYDCREIASAIGKILNDHFSVDAATLIKITN